jgi:hypothetical protein
MNGFSGGFNMNWSIEDGINLPKEEGHRLLANNEIHTIVINSKHLSVTPQVFIPHPHFPHFPGFGDFQQRSWGRASLVTWCPQSS